MPSWLYLTSVLLFGSALAAPYDPTPYILKRQDGPCADIGDQKHVARLGYYSNRDCSKFISGICVYMRQDTIDAGYGWGGCNPGILPDSTPFYTKVLDTPFNAIQFLFTREQSCPPTGAGAVFATLVDNASCVLFNLGGDAPGVTIFPNGGSRISREIAKRANTKCEGFVIEDSEPSQSRTVQISNISDCTNGAEQGCTITVGAEQSQSVSTSFSLSVGGGVEGIFSVEATFGMEFTSTSTTSIQNGFTVAQGQKGYLGAYSAATLFHGKFTGCDSGDAEQPGSVLAMKKNGFTYSVINTGS